MNKIIPACFVMLLAAARTAAAQTVETPLEKVSVEAPDALVFATMPFVRPQARPAFLKGQPAGLEGKVHYFVVALGDKRMVAAMPAEDPKILYVDRNLDDDLSDEKPLTADAGRMQLFGTVELALGKTTVKLALAGYGGRVLLAYNPVRLTGTLELGGLRRQVALLDGNRDGTCNGVFAGRPEACDVMGLDFNGDGKIVRYDRQSRQYEILPMPRLLKLGDTWYAVKVDAAKPSIALTKTDPKMATLKVDKATTLTMVSDSGYHSLSGEAESYRLPEGLYVVLRTQVVKTDKEGIAWTLQGSAAGKAMALSADEPTQWGLGGPLTVKPVVVKTGAGTYNLNVSVTGAGGESYAAGALKEGKRAPAPTYKVLSEKGEVLAQGAMEYG